MVAVISVVELCVFLGIILTSIMQLPSVII